MPLVSVIIPAYNAAKTVEKTVRSVMASTIPLDVWVVDDGSTDGSSKLLDDLTHQTSTSSVPLAGACASLRDRPQADLPSELRSAAHLAPPCLCDKVPPSDARTPFLAQRHRGTQRSTEEFLSPVLNSQPSTLNILRQANQGAYMARLNALKRITTPYFGFVDADDTIEPDMFEKMLAVAEREKCDVVQCGVEGVADSEIGAWYVRLNEKWKMNNEKWEMDNEKCVEGNSTCSSFLPGLILPDRCAVEEQFIKPHLVKGEGSSFIWNKLYRNQYDFSQFVTFDRLTNYDDMIFNFQFFEKVKRMAFMPDKLYHYAATAGSATHSYGARQFEDFKACAKFRRERGVPSRRWLAVNLKSAAASVLRAKMRLGEKAKWLARLAAMVGGEGTTD